MRKIVESHLYGNLLQLEDKCDSLGKEVVNLNTVLSDAEEEKKRLLMEANQVRLFMSSGHLRHPACTNIIRMDQQVINGLLLRLFINELLRLLMSGD